MQRSAVPGHPTIEQVVAAVDEALSAFLDTQAARLGAVGPDLAPVVDVTGDFVRDGGKRLRPVFACWGFVGAGGTLDAATFRAVAALELLHACALVHDDVMDGSDLRRGRPAVHRRMQALHERSGWTGSAEAFGVAGAILVGDLLLAWSDECLHGSGADPAALRRAQPVWDEMRTELMAGQYLDMLEQAIGEADLARALRVARYKSGKYTIERPLHLGAALAAPDPEGAVAGACSAYGLPLGEAFQLRDDVLGVFGDPSLTGKPAGDDLREGKRTALVAAALDRAEGSAAALLRRRLGDPDLDDAGVAALQEVIVTSGGLALVEGLIADRTEEALAALDDAPITEAGRAGLRTLAERATRRTV